MNKVSHTFALFRVYRQPGIWLRILDKLRLLPVGKEYIVKLKNGLKLALRGSSSDFEVLDEILIHRNYDWALDGIGKDDVVCDLGSNIGVFALFAALRGASVFAYEPLQENFAVLLKNVDLNECGKKVHACNLAVGGTTGLMQLFFKRGVEWGATKFPSLPGWLEECGELKNGVQSRMVQAVTLHQLLKDNNIQMCNCLKIDCEGAEYEIFEQVDREDFDRIRSIILEYHSNGNAEALAGILREAGFRCNIFPEKQILFASK